MARGPFEIDLQSRRARAPPAKVPALPIPGDTICGEILLEQLAPAGLDYQHHRTGEDNAEDRKSVV